MGHSGRLSAGGSRLTTGNAGVYPGSMPAKPTATFTFEDLLCIYKEWNSDGRAYEHISEILEIAKDKHKAAWRPKPGQAGDHGQAWRAWKGKNFEKLVQFIVTDEVDRLNRSPGYSLGTTSDTALDHDTLPTELDRVKRNLLVHYGKYGSHLPDADVIIYDCNSAAVLCILSCKVTMRERIAQTAYWKLKLGTSPVTRHVRVALVTPDEDGNLISRPHPAMVKKNYAIASTDIDTTYVLNEALQPTDRIKSFSDFARDVKSWAKRGGGGGGGLVSGRPPLTAGARPCRAVPAAA